MLSVIVCFAAVIMAAVAAIKGMMTLPEIAVFTLLTSLILSLWDVEMAIRSVTRTIQKIGGLS